MRNPARLVLQRRADVKHEQDKIEASVRRFEKSYNAGRSYALGEAEGDGDGEEPPPASLELSDFFEPEDFFDEEEELFFVEEDWFPELPDFFAVELCWLLLAVVLEDVSVLFAHDAKNATLARIAREEMRDRFMGVC